MNTYMSFLFGPKYSLIRRNHHHLVPFDRLVSKLCWTSQKIWSRDQRNRPISQFCGRVGDRPGKVCMVSVVRDEIAKWMLCWTQAWYQKNQELHSGRQIKGNMDKQKRASGEHGRRFVEFRQKVGTCAWFSEGLDSKTRVEETPSVLKQVLMQGPKMGRGIWDVGWLVRFVDSIGRAWEGEICDGVLADGWEDKFSGRR
jgi:hypothetical protein